MEARFHKRVQSDLNKIIEHYSSISDSLGHDFYDEFMIGLSNVSRNPRFYHFDASGLRRCNLHRFPYHFLYDIEGPVVRIWVLRSDKQRPSLGVKRFKK